MSRVGRRPIAISDKVTISYENKSLDIKGPKGALTFKVPELVDLKIEDGLLIVQADYQNNTRAKVLMGTIQATINNMVIGVTDGFKKQLILKGIGYRASVSGNKIELNLGYSHPILVTLPEGVGASVSKYTINPGKL